MFLCIVLAVGVYKNLRKNRLRVFFVYTRMLFDALYSFINNHYILRWTDIVPLGTEWGDE